MTFELVNGKVSLDITTSQAVFCGTENKGEMKTFSLLQIPFTFRLRPRFLIVKLDKTKSIMRQNNVFTFKEKMVFWFRDKGSINLMKLKLISVDLLIFAAMMIIGIFTHKIISFFGRQDAFKNSNSGNCVLFVLCTS